MPVFVYQARDKSGARCRGTMEALNSATVAARLREQGLRPTRIREAAADTAPWASGFRHALRPVPEAHLAQFFTQLAGLLRSGMNIYEAMTHLVAQLGDTRLARVAREMAPRLAEGDGLADNLARYPLLFPAHVPAMVRAGEQFGALPEVLESLAEQLTTEAAISSRLRWVRWYYSAVLVFAVLVAPFPLMIARGIAWYGRLAFSILLPGLLGAFILLWVLRGVLNLPAFAGIRLIALCSLPLFGSVARWGALSRLLETLQIAQRAGVTFDQGLEMAGLATGHPHMIDTAHTAAARLRQGASVDEALNDRRLLPAQAREMLVSGARAGRLETSITAATQWAQERRDSAVAAVTGAAVGAALILSALMTLVALAIAWRNYYSALFERIGV